MTYGSWTGDGKAHSTVVLCPQTRMSYPREPSILVSVASFDERQPQEEAICGSV
jgi:hypothetical protein